MKKVLDLLTDPYIMVPALLGGAAAYYMKGKEAEGAGKYTWPAGGVAAGMAVGHVIRSKMAPPAEAPQVAAPQPQQQAAPPPQQAISSDDRALPEHVELSSDDTEMYDNSDGTHVDVDEMFSEYTEDTYEEPIEADYPAAAPSEGYRGPAPAPEAVPTATEAHAYAVADAIAEEMGHGSLGNGNGVSDTDLAEGWGGFGEPSLDGDVGIEDLAEGVPGMTKGRNGAN